MSKDSFTSPGFILGSGRSGTTLLAAVLNRHSRVCVTPETHFFQHVSQYPGKSAAFAANWPASLRDIARKMPPTSAWDPVSCCEEVIREFGNRKVSVAAAFLALGARIAASSGKPLWIEKTPMHNYYIPEIRSFFPRAPIIHIVRDGRDVAASMVAARWCGSYFENLVRWVAELRATEAALKGDPQGWSVRYEDLVTDPRATVMRLCEFLGLEFEPAMLTPDGSEQGLIEQGMTHKEQVRQPISAAKVAAWRNHLTPDQAATVVLLAGRDLARWNYPAEVADDSAALTLWLGRKFDTLPQEQYYDRVIDLLRGLNRPVRLDRVVAPYDENLAPAPDMYIIAGLQLGAAYTPRGLRQYTATLARTLWNCLRIRRSGTVLLYHYHGDPGVTRRWRLRMMVERMIVSSSALIICSCQDTGDCAAHRVFRALKAPVLHPADSDFAAAAVKTIERALASGSGRQS